MKEELEKRQEESIKEYAMRLLHDCKSTYKQLNAFIENQKSEVDNGQRFNAIEPFGDPNQWGKIKKGQVGVNYSDEFWKQLAEVLVLLKTQQYDGSVFKIVQDAAAATTTAVSVRQEVRYGVFICQDTVLPLFFKYAHQRNANVHFKIMESWNKCIQAFTTNDIDVALHDFSSAITATIEHGRPFIFFPFFWFKGYGLFIKRSAVDNFCDKRQIARKKFNSLDYSDKKLFLETHKVLLNIDVDLEWVYKKFCERFGCDLEKIDSMIDDCDINEGREIFEKHNRADLYVTGSIHIADLRRQADKYEFIIGDNLTLHKNANGLICDSTYYETNKSIVSELINAWFDSVGFFRKDITIQSQLEADGETVVDFISFLPKFLCDLTGANVSLEQLAKMYKLDNDDFSTNLKETFDVFYSENSTDSRSNYQNYISMVNMFKKYESDVIEKAIKDIFNYMKKFKINF